MTFWSLLLRGWGRYVERMSLKGREGRELEEGRGKQKLIVSWIWVRCVGFLMTNRVYAFKFQLVRRSME